MINQFEHNIFMVVYRLTSAGEYNYKRQTI